MLDSGNAHLQTTLNHLVAPQKLHNERQFGGHFEPFTNRSRDMEHAQ